MFLDLLSPCCRLVRTARGGFGQTLFFFLAIEGQSHQLSHKGESCIAEASSSNSLLTKQQRNSGDSVKYQMRLVKKSVRARKVLNGRVAELVGREEMRREVPEQTA